MLINARDVDVLARRSASPCVSWVMCLVQSDSCVEALADAAKVKRVRQADVEQASAARSPTPAAALRRWPC